MANPIKLMFLLIGFLLLGWAVSNVDLTIVASLLVELGYGFILLAMERASPGNAVYAHPALL